MSRPAAALATAPAPAGPPQAAPERPLSATAPAAAPAARPEPPGGGDERLTPKTLSRSLKRASMAQLLTPLTGSFFEETETGRRRMKRLSQIVRLNESEEGAEGGELADRRVLNILCDNPRSSRVALVVHSVLTVSVLLSIFFIWLESMHGPNHGSSDPTYPGLPTQGEYDTAEAVFTAIFTVEFLVRLAIAESYWRPVASGTVPFARDVFNWLDLAAIIPFYVAAVVDSASGGSEPSADVESTIRVIKLCRVVRVFKVARHFPGTAAMSTAVRNSATALALPMLFFAVMTLLFGTLVYFFEPCFDASECQFTDIFSASYFVMVSMTTVGYGDQVPTVTGAVVVTIVVLYYGSVFLAMPLAVVGNEFVAAAHAGEEAERQSQIAPKTPRNGSTPARSARSSPASAADPDAPTAPPDSLGLVQSSSLPVKVLHHRAMSHFLAFGAAVGEATVAAFSMRDSAPSGLEDATSALLFRVRLAQRRHRAICEDLDAFVPHSQPAGAGAGAEPPVQEPARRPRAPRRSLTVMNLVALEAAPPRAAWKERLFYLLDVPDSSPRAKRFSRFMMWTVALSVLAYCAQSLPEMQPAGDDSDACRHLARIACEADGVTAASDPGCFVWPAGDAPLDFDDDCTSSSSSDGDCFGQGLNFGARAAGGLTCAACDGHDGNDAGSGAAECPFDAGAKHPVCVRPQCDNEYEWVADLTPLWLPVELVFALIFTAELTLRALVAPRKELFFRDPFNWIDLGAILPFYVAVAEAVRDGEPVTFTQPAGEASFLSVLRLCKVFRVFKITRHVPSWELLVLTARRSWRRLLVPLFFNLLLVVVMAALIYEAEAGTECIVGGAPCGVELPAAAQGLANGTRVLVNDLGELSDFEDGFKAFWFVIVAVTSVGYGDRVPVTSLGKALTVVTMILGTFYNAMPLTLVGGTFYQVYKERQQAANGGLPMTDASDIQSSRRASSPVHTLRLSTAQRIAVSRFHQMRQYLDAIEQALVGQLDRFSTSPSSPSSSSSSSSSLEEEKRRVHSMGNRVAGVLSDAQQMTHDVVGVMQMVRMEGFGSS